jgi:hypothetical protein
MTQQGWAAAESATWTERLSDRWTNPSWWNLLIALPWAIGLVIFVFGWNKDRDVASRERSVDGVVTAHDPANHNRYTYTFVVQGKSYTGQDIPRHADPVLGRPVLVYYDPLSPEKNALTDFDELSGSALGPALFATIGIGTLAAVIVVRRRQFRRHMAARIP